MPRAGEGAAVKVNRPRFLYYLLIYLSQRFTPTGRALLVIWFATALQGSVSLDLPLYHIWSFTSVTLGVAWLWAWVALPKVKLTRYHLKPVSAGTTLTLEVEIENASRRTAYNVTVMELNLPPGIECVDNIDPPIQSRLGPREVVRLPLRLQCMRRGIYRLSGLYAASAFPLGVCRSMRFSLQDADLVVYPACRLLPEYLTPSTTSLATHDKALPTSWPSASTEFIHTREYRAGDHPRHMHWASWARLGTPTVKVYQDADAERVALVLDTSAPYAAADNAFETAVSVIASAGVELAQQGYAIDRLVAGEHVYRLCPTHSEASIGPLLELLAGVGPSGQLDWSSMALAFLPNSSRLRAAVCVVLDWSSARAGFVEHLQQRGMRVRTIVVHDGPTSRPAPALPLSLYQHLPPDDGRLSAGTPHAL
jgi:uncharacterized protein (DUF58 family)